MESDGGPGDDGSRYIDDRAGDLCMAVERAAIMFDFEVERTAPARMANNASGAIFDVDGEVVSAVELAIWACTSDAVKAASTSESSRSARCGTACSRRRVAGSRSRG